MGFGFRMQVQVGYSLPESLGTKPIAATGDSAANSYVDKACGKSFADFSVSGTGRS